MPGDRDDERLPRDLSCDEGLSSVGPLDDQVGMSHPSPRFDGHEMKVVPAASHEPGGDHIRKPLSPKKRRGEQETIARGRMIAVDTTSDFAHAAAVRAACRRRAPRPHNPTRRPFRWTAMT